MTKEKNKLLSLDVVYLVFGILLIICSLQSNNVLDWLLFVVTTFYYIRIKIYRWKKYH